MNASEFPFLIAADNLVLDSVTSKPVAVVLPGNYRSSELATFIAEARTAAGEAATLRRFLAQVVEALGEGGCLPVDASMDVYAAIPAEVDRTVKLLKSEQLSTMQRLQARVKELEKHLTSALEADPPTATGPTHVVPGAVCRWCGQDGIQQYSEPDTVCPRCQQSIFTGPQEQTRIPLNYMSARCMTPVPVERSHYYILHGDSVDWVRQQVERMIGEGWRPVGGVCVTSNDALLKTEPVRHFYQAVER